MDRGRSEATIEKLRDMAKQSVSLKRLGNFFNNAKLSQIFVQL